MPLPWTRRASPGAPKGGGSSSAPPRFRWPSPCCRWWTTPGRTCPCCPSSAPRCSPSPRTVWPSCGPGALAACMRRWRREPSGRRRTAWPSWPSWGNCGPWPPRRAATSCCGTSTSAPTCPPSLLPCPRAGPAEPTSWPCTRRPGGLNLEATRASWPFSSTSPAWRKTACPSLWRGRAWGACAFCPSTAPRVWSSPWCSCAAWSTSSTPRTPGPPSSSTRT